MMQAQTPTPPVAPTPVIAGAGGQTQIVGGSSPSAIYEGFKNQREELGRQLDRLESQREDISRQLQQPELNSVDQKALEQRLGTVDQRIAETEKLIAGADARVAQTAAIPGAVVPQPDLSRQGPPEEVFVLTGIFFLVVLMPISIAFARRIWRRGKDAVTKLPQEIYDRFARVDQSLDAIAVEVERIGEGQRFLTKLQTEQRAIGAGAAERIEVPVGERQREKHSR